MNELALFVFTSHCAATRDIAIPVHRRKMGKWTKNTDTAKRKNVSFAEISSLHEIREASRNVARICVVAPCKQEKHFDSVLSAARYLCLLGLDTRHAHAHAELLSGCRAESLTQWSKCVTGLLFFAALLLRDACGTKRIELRCFSGILSRNCMLTSNPILKRGCRGATTERDSKNGV